MNTWIDGRLGKQSSRRGWRDSQVPTRLNNAARWNLRVLVYLCWQTLVTGDIPSSDGRGARYCNAKNEHMGAEPPLAQSWVLGWK